MTSTLDPIATLKDNEKQKMIDEYNRLSTQMHLAAQLTSPNPEPSSITAIRAKSITSKPTIPNDYIIVTDTNIEEFQQKINKHMSEGYILNGPLTTFLVDYIEYSVRVFIQSKSTKVVNFIQPMIKQQIKEIQ